MHAKEAYVSSPPGNETLVNESPEQALRAQMQHQLPSFEPVHSSVPVPSRVSSVPVPSMVGSPSTNVSREALLSTYSQYGGVQYWHVLA